jgi:hypothetical protein
MIVYVVCTLRAARFVVEGDQQEQKQALSGLFIVANCCCGEVFALSALVARGTETLLCYPDTKLLVIIDPSVTNYLILY